MIILSLLLHTYRNPSLISIKKCVSPPRQKLFCVKLVIFKEVIRHYKYGTLIEIRLQDNDS